ncbi:MAG TPA: VWA domain-containing protein [Pyrinomonadaceae bacterium]
MSGEEKSDRELTGAADEGPDDAIERAFRERLRAVKSVTERRTLGGLARELGKLPVEAAYTSLETSAAIAGVSLRASMEFLRAAPEAARVLEATELRAWGEIGRRLAMGDVETAVSFFAAGVDALSDVPIAARPLIFQICARQMTLSSSVAVETFRRAPLLAAVTADAAELRSIFEVAAEISRRSAKHSADFLEATPRVVESFGQFVAERQSVAAAAITLAAAFAARAGGIAADVWAALPAALAGQTAPHALELLRSAGAFLERGGSSALQTLLAGSHVLRSVPEAFKAWLELLWTIAEHGNAGLVAFVRASPAFFQILTAELQHAEAARLSLRIISVTREIAVLDGEAALACFRSSAKALHAVSIEQFEQWAREGLTNERNRRDARARRSYYALETARSNDALHTSAAHGGLPLERVQHTLRLYVEGLTGRSIEIQPLAAVPVEARINDGRTIHLPSLVAEFGDEASDFRLYKVLAAHAAGQIEFGTHERESSDLRAAYTSIAELYAPENADARDAFALDGYINEPGAGEAALAPEEEARRQRRERPALPPGADYRAALSLFPHPNLARRIFGTLENGRIERRLRHIYRGLARDLDWTRLHLRNSRPRIIDLPVTLVPFELLFQITLCGGALDDARNFYGQIVSELEGIVAVYLTSPEATVADTLMATVRVYSLFQSITPDEAQQEVDSSTEQSDSGREGATSQQQQPQSTQPTPERKAQPRDARELFNAWTSTEPQGDPEELDGAEMWAQGELPEQGLEQGEVAYNYDEWDRELTDHRVGWCRVIEKRVQRGPRSFVEDTRERYRGVISSIRRQFQLMKPEHLLRVANELDGEDYDLSAVIDYVIDRRADGQQSERIYTKRLRRQRDVAVSFLLDQSSSTARTIGRHPLQPYTHPGRRIIEVEKEGLVLMSEALEAVGDAYSINGFTSEGRRNVKFYIVKDFDEHYTEEIERRIGGITYQNNTRLGAAIRHAAARLIRQPARTHLLIVLSDGRPYDHDYGDARYAREDTREALRQAKQQGIIPFCITIDRESETELRDLYGEIGYTIIDDVLSLPERMPGIYRRLTT